MSYFTAVIARRGADWRAVDVALEDAESLDEVAQMMRGASRGGPVLAVLEREDQWFALVRVDGDDDDARSFVSDLAATERSRYAEVLAPVGDVDLAEYSHLRATRPVFSDEDDDAAEDVEEEPDQEIDYGADDDPLVGPDEAAGGPTSGNGVDGEPAQLEPPVAAAPETPAWAGDPGLLADVGVGADELVEMVREREGDPASVIAAVGERCGFDDLLDALR